jgi:hypothetical protein
VMSVLDAGFGNECPTSFVCVLPFNFTSLVAFG